MGDPLTNGWLQLAIAIGSMLGLLCFALALRSGQLRFPKPNLS
jgi:acyl dehydratase